MPAAMVGLEAGGLEIELVGRADAAGGEQQHLRRARRGRPRAWTMQPPLADARSAPTLEPSRSAMPRSRRSWMNSSISSWSMKSSMVGRGSISVTARRARRRWWRTRRRSRRRRSPRGCAADLAGRRSRRCRRRSRRRTAHSRAGTAGCRRRSGSARPRTILRLAAVGRDLDLVRIDEARLAAHGLHPLRANWCSSTSTSWSSVMCRRWRQVVRGDVLLDPVGASVEAALAPAGEIEHGLAQGLGGMVPVWTETPPTRRPFSTTSTDLPSLAAWIGGAAARRDRCR